MRPVFQNYAKSIGSFRLWTFQNTWQHRFSKINPIAFPQTPKTNIPWVYKLERLQTEQVNILEVLSKEMVVFSSRSHNKWRGDKQQCHQPLPDPTVRSPSTKYLTCSIYIHSSLKDSFLSFLHQCLSRCSRLNCWILYPIAQKVSLMWSVAGYFLIRVWNPILCVFNPLRTGARKGRRG